MVSVIIPIYNAEDYIEKCLNSIINQDYRSLEILVINDGSNDGSLEICKRIALHDERIQIISTENCGVSRARNKGLSLASGQYICFIDADDYVDKDYIKKYVDVINQTKADVVAGGIIEEHSDRTILKKNQNLVLDNIACKNLVHSLLDNRTDDLKSYDPQILGFLTGKIYRRDKIKNINFPENIPIREDAIFNAKVFLNIKKLVLSDVTGYHYVINDKSATGKYRSNYNIEAKMFLKECKKIWKNNNLHMNSLYVGYLYTYMRWIKLYVIHSKSGHTVTEQINLIKESFKDDVWNEGFNKVDRKSINIQYRFLRKMFIKEKHIGIYILCKMSEVLKR